jgi:3-hydroxyisobutyrate dehydrogenase-like beta-hydroxyacid dehydrogenase
MKIGFVGLGDMGLPMARRLLAYGHEVTVWNRSPGKSNALAAEGANAVCSLPELMSRSELVGLCLTSDVAVEQVAFGPDGLLNGQPLEGRAIADFSTGSPEAAIKFAGRAAGHGVHWVDAPVSGGVPAAAAGTLIVMAGGTPEAVARLTPIFAAVSARATHVGPSGSGQTLKICNQLIVSCNFLVLAETIALARKAGVDVARLHEALRGGFADSTPLQIFGPRMASHVFEPRLGAISLMQKDVGLAAQLASRFGAEAPMLHRAMEIYAREGLLPDADISTLISLFEKVAS